VRVLLVLLAVVGPQRLAAQTIDLAGDLYTAQTIVTGTGEPERTRGFRAGLEDVVVKLTGDARLASSPELAGLLRDPHRLIERFEYEDRMKGIPVHDEQGTRERPHFLRMRFKTEDIEAELARLRLAKWAEPRPLLAIWLAVRTAKDSYLLQNRGDRGYGQRAVIAEAALRRGIPVHLPPGAPAQQSAVTFADIAESRLDGAKEASSHCNAWLFGLLSVTAEGYWNIAWHLEWEGKQRTWNRAGVSFDTALKDGLETSALVLSGKGAI